MIEWFAMILDNPARLLHHHFSRLHSSMHGRKSARDVLAGIFGFEPSDYSAARRSLTLLDGLFPATEAKLRLVPRLAPEHYTRHFPPLRKGLAVVQLDEYLEKKVGFLSPR